MKEVLHRKGSIQPKVSVIIPTYNGEKFIRQSIDSVLNQTYKNLEIIVVDDGSTRDIKTLLGLYSDKISYLYMDNKGPAAARNKGIRICEGEYIALLDHDDMWAPDNLEKKVCILDKNPSCSMVYSYPILIDADGGIIENEPPSFFPSGKVFRDFLISNRVSTFSSTLIRKAIFEKIGYLDESPQVMTCDDYDLWLRIADSSEILFCAGTNVYYRLHEDNLVNNFDQSLSAHLLVYWRAIRNLESVKDIHALDLLRIVRKHLYDKYKQFAYKYYYLTRYDKARTLFLRAIVLHPMNIKNWTYFVVSFMPQPIIKAIKLFKGKLCTVIC